MLYVGFVSSAQLSNKYLPPNYAGSSGGHGGFLQTPQKPSNQYLAPKGNLHYKGVSSSAGAGRSAGHGFAGAASSHSPVHASAGGHHGAGFRGGHSSAAAQIPILRSNYNDDGNGNYNFGYVEN